MECSVARLTRYIIYQNGKWLLSRVSLWMVFLFFFCFLKKACNINFDRFLIIDSWQLIVTYHQMLNYDRSYLFFITILNSCLRVYQNEDWNTYGAKSETHNTALLRLLYRTQWQNDVSVPADNHSTRRVISYLLFFSRSISHGFRTIRDRDRFWIKGDKNG